MMAVFSPRRKQAHSRPWESLAKGLAMEANEQFKGDVNCFPSTWKEYRELNVKVIMTSVLYSEPSTAGGPSQPPTNSHRPGDPSAAEAGGVLQRHPSAVRRGTVSALDSEETLPHWQQPPWPDFHPWKEGFPGMMCTPSRHTTDSGVLS